MAGRGLPARPPGRFPAPAAPPAKPLQILVGADTPVTAADGGCCRRGFKPWITEAGPGVLIRYGARSDLTSWLSERVVLTYGAGDAG